MHPLQTTELPARRNSRTLQLNSISLSKNCLRALEAARTDMPSMEQFPKSHIVTFRYYLGVIHFLDEEYHK
ncbi:MAG: hypothetical protein Q9193_005950, partial [Seirophora villosa]